MADFNCAPSRPLAPGFAGLPHPEPLRIPSHSGGALPRPISSLPNVADSGRVCFGAGYRLPASK
jgi:hypothetical protein